jgi:AraC-like DNA-binding protein
MGSTFIIRAQSPSQMDQIARLRLIDPCIAGGFRHTRLRAGSARQAAAAPALFADGEEEICEIGKGFLITVGNAWMTQDWAVNCRSVEAALRIRILQAGHASFGAGTRFTGVWTDSCSYAIQPAGAWMSVYYRGQEPLRLINISVTRRYLEDALGLTDRELPGVLLRRWHLGACSFGTLRLAKASQRLAATLVQRNGRGRWRHVWLSSAATQLLGSIFEDWLEQRDDAGLPIRLSLRDSDRLALAVELLRSTWHAPLTSAELVKRTGLNKNKLHYGLRQLLGMSASAYYTHLRMQRALELVRGAEHSISRISERLGFSEHTNFTSVFRRHFGATPREVRRDARRPEKTHSDGLPNHVDVPFRRR